MESQLENIHYQTGKSPAAHGNFILPFLGNMEYPKALLITMKNYSRLKSLFYRDCHVQGVTFLQLVVTNMRILQVPTSQVQKRQSPSTLVQYTILNHHSPTPCTQVIKQSLSGSYQSSSKASVSVYVGPTLRTYKFSNLVGNTTYRASVESFELFLRLLRLTIGGTFFQNDVSLWYASNVSWTAPEIRETGHSAVINQHLLSVYEFLPATKSLTKKFSLNVPVPMSTYAIGRLTPGSVYNITLQAGTNYGYGTLGWAVFSTLYRNEDGFILKQRLKTPNAITLTWPAQWLPSPTSRFTAFAKKLMRLIGVVLGSILFRKYGF
ncbi:unnamed protein product [Strongylus vulgaris]|uniref:Fibronectin type-III domain-containing protein n=1 Tax=Strongylus vulgaris TaxID=40348 RepID=A0A3P7L8Q2_STRVU|nr:unnamed protein product [Strongylus vulgaris]